MLLRKCAFVLFGIFFSVFTNPAMAESKPKIIKATGIAIHGKPKYSGKFANLAYADPKALKGGTIVLEGEGGYDSFNPFSLKGNPAPGLALYMHDALFTEAQDDPSVEYCLICESIEYPEDRSWITFHLNPKAKFNDGSPITAEDVAWSMEALKKNLPQYKGYYADVKPAVVIDTHTVRFDFTKPNNELPVIVGQLPVLSKKYWEKHDLSKTTLEPPLGNGPYKIKSFDAGRSITYERVKDHWAADLPIRKGFYNFDEIRHDIYADDSVALEAFKGGAYDYRMEASSKNWAQGYEIEAKKNGQLITELVPDDSPQGVQGFAFNTRRPIFSDRRVREALILLFDFEWANSNLFFNTYTRVQSYFENSVFAARGLPKGEELKILQKHKAKLAPEVFTKPVSVPSNKTDEDRKTNLRKALALFAEAGWSIEGGALKNKAGQPFEFEFLATADPGYERIIISYQKSLQKAGIQLKVRTVDRAQYINRTRDFDFDMVSYRRGQSDSPGNEQRDYWSIAAAKKAGSKNFMGIQDPVIDQIIEDMVEVKDRNSLIAHIKALDRLLMWGHYLVPNWYLAKARIAYWNKFGRPAKNPPRGVSFLTWWIDPAKEAKLKKARGR